MTKKARRKNKAKMPENGPQPAIPSVEPATLSIEQALGEAIARHKAGLFRDAECIYQAILQIQPNHPDVNHNLGLMAVSEKQPTVGLPYFKTALEAKPSEGQYWLSYAEALLASGQPIEALNILQTAMQRGLDTPAAHTLLQKIEAAKQTA
jgi:predicted Zn-dependent protease